MGKYEKILIVFIVILIAFFAIVLIQMNNARSQYNKEKEINSLDKTDDKLQQRLSELEEKQKTLEEKTDKKTQVIIKDEKKPSEKPLNRVDVDLVKYLVTETINKDNLQTKTRWQPTNTSGISVIAVKLDFEPVEDSIMVWSGMGLLPVDSYRVQDVNTLLIIFQQTQEAFVAGNNYINIRYFKRKI